MQISIADILQIFSKYNTLCFDNSLSLPKKHYGKAL